MTFEFNSVGFQDDKHSVNMPGKFVLPFKIYYQDYTSDQQSNAQGANSI